MSRAPLFDDRVVLAAALLAVFLAASAALDRKRHGAGAKRWREYAQLFTVALFGALAGACVNFVTGKISPEYFTLGKGLPGDARFTLRTVALGVQSGFAAGMVAGALLLFAAGGLQKRPGELPTRRFLAYLGFTGAVALAGATLAGFLPPAWSPLKLSAEELALLGPAIAPKFEQVRAIHLACYLGLAAGTAISIAHALRLRRRKPADES